MTTRAERIYGWLTEPTNIDRLERAASVAGTVAVVADLAAVPGRAVQLVGTVKDTVDDLGGVRPRAPRYESPPVGLLARAKGR